MGAIGRFMTATNAAIRAFRDVYTQTSNNAYWGDNDARLARYQHYRYWENNFQYFDRVNKYATAYRSEHALYRSIRGIYSPVARLTKLVKAKVYVGNISVIDPTNPMSAIPIVTENDLILPAISQLWQWSNWNTKKGLYVRNGALLGDSFIKIVDSQDAGKVYMEVLDPDYVVDADFDAFGNITSITIEYVTIDEESYDEQQTYTYREEITPETYRTYKDGKLFAYPQNTINGERVAEWDNVYGFVPVVLAPYEDVGKNWGKNAFTDYRGKIDELNDLASVLHDNMRKANNPILVAKGVSTGDKLDLNQSNSPQTVGQTPTNPKENRSALPMLRLRDKEGSIDQLAMQIDIAGGVQAMDRLIDELNNDLPILALQQIRSQGGNLTAPGVRTAYSDAVDEIKSVRSNFDSALVRAQVMALTMGGIQNYSGFEPFNENSAMNGDLTHEIADRAVIPDTLSQSEKMQLLSTAGIPAALTGELLGLTSEQIDQIRQHEREQAEAAASGFVSGLFGQASR